MIAHLSPVYSFQFLSAFLMSCKNVLFSIEVCSMFEYISGHFSTDLSEEVCNFFHGVVSKLYMVEEFFFNTCWVI